VTDNKEISKILGMMWNKASHEVKQPFIIKELALRAKYNEDIAQWRKERDDRIAEERSQRESIVHHAIETGTSDQIIRDAELSRRSIAVDSRNTSNCYGYSASFTYHPPCTNHYHGSEENSAPHFPQRPFDTEVCQHCHHAPYALDDMHAIGDERYDCPTHFLHLGATVHRPYLENGSCSGYDAYGNSGFQERPQYSCNSNMRTEGYGRRDISITSSVDQWTYDVPLVFDIPPQMSQLEPYSLQDIQAINSRERQDYLYNDCAQSIFFVRSPP
jgi:hypothetical protein